MRTYAIKHLFSAFLILLSYSLTTSCESDDDSNATIQVSTEMIDFGDVPAGSGDVREFTVKGEGLEQVIYPSITGEFFTLSTDLLPVANVENSLTVSFAPNMDAIQQPVSATIEIVSGDISQTIAVTANIIEPEGLPVDTEVYFNDMEYGLDHNTPLSASDFEGAQVLHPTVSASYELVPFDGDPSRIRTNGQFPKCEDNTVGDTCGNAMRIVGLGTRTTISLSGFEPERSYEVSYWVRVGGSSDRSLNVTVTGDTEPAFEDWGGGDSSIYTQVIRNGIADESGDFEISFEYAQDSTGRTISVDDLRIIAK